MKYFSKKSNKMKLPLIVCITLLTLNISFAQVSVQWEYPTTFAEEGQAIDIDSANNIFTVGMAGTITKFDHLGDTVFSIVNGYGLQMEAVDMMIDHENNIITIGNYYLGNKSMKVQKIDDTGNLLWEIIIDTILGDRDAVHAMDIDENNNIYITGHSGDQFFNKKLYTAKISKNGTILWENETINAVEDVKTGIDIVVKDSNNIYSVSSIDLPSSRKSALLVKYNNLGNVVWTRQFSYHDWKSISFGVLKTEGKKVTVDDFGNVYIVGKALVDDVSFVVKYDSSGTYAWARDIDLDTNKTYYEDIITDSTGIYVAGTEFWGSTNTHSICAAKLSFTGTTLWDTRIDGVGADGKYLAKHKDGVVLSGWTLSVSSYQAFITARLDSIGAVDWIHEYVSSVPTNSGDEPHDLVIDNSGGIYITGEGNGSTLNLSHTFKIFDCELINPTLNLIGNTLIANEIPGAMYKWYNCSSGAIIDQGVELFQYTPIGIGGHKVEISVGTCSDTSSCLVNINCNLNSTYSYINNGNGNYSFSNNSTGIFNKTHWAFGDGTTSTVANPNHTFSANGTYVVVLTVNDSTIGSSCIDYFMDTIFVIGVVAPLQCAAGFVMYPDAGDVTVVNSSTGTNLAYLWDFGDGNTSILQTPNHTYSNSGSDQSFLLCLTVDDGAGCVDTYCDSIGQNGVVFNKQTGFTINVIAPPLATQVNEQAAIMSAMSIYPNPTGKKLHVVFNKSEPYQLKIVTIDGKLIETKTIVGNTTLDVSNYSSGMYFITATNNEGKVYQSKFVKE